MSRGGRVRPGLSEPDIDTPALVVDLDALERNLDRMAAAARAAGVALRPHVKTHKSVNIALMQLERGAVGVCVQTVSEAEAMVAGGIREVLVANEVVGPGKLRRVAHLARDATITVCVDDPGNLDDLGRSVRRAGSSLGVMVEMNTAEYRAGVPPGQPLLRLAQRVEATPSVCFAGIQAYNGVAQHVRDHSARLAATAAQHRPGAGIGGSAGPSWHPLRGGQRWRDGNLRPRSGLRGMNTAEYRAGVPPGQPLLRLAQRVEATPSVCFAGIQAYNGVAQHVRDHSARLAATERNIALVQESVDLLDRHGIRCEVVSGGGTGTYALEAASEVYNEIQPGTYVFMDADYLANRDRLGGPFRDFEVGLYVLATVMSRRPRIAIVDAGLKAVSLGNGLPLVKGGKALYKRFADEHGVLAPSEGSLPPLGSQVRLIPVNCDPTVNLYDHLIGVRNGMVEAVWPVDARGY